MNKKIRDNICIKFIHILNISPFMLTILFKQMLYIKFILTLCNTIYQYKYNDYAYENIIYSLHADTTHLVYKDIIHITFTDTIIHAKYVKALQLLLDSTKNKNGQYFFINCCELGFTLRFTTRFIWTCIGCQFSYLFFLQSLETLVTWIFIFLFYIYNMQNSFNLLLKVIIYSKTNFT